MLEGWGQGKISAFTDTDKNNCIKFELVKFATDKNGKKRNKRPPKMLGED